MHLHLTLFVVYVAVSHGATLRQYDRDWLMSDAIDSALSPRRITAKSVFVAPSNVRCSPGWRADGDGRCVRVVTVRQEAQIQFLSDKLNALFGNKPQREKVTAVEVVSVESTSVVENMTMPTSSRPLVETTTLVSEEENTAAEVEELSGDGPIEVDIWDIYPDITATTYSQNVTPTENVFIVPENETTPAISTTETTEGVTELEVNSTEVTSSTADTTFVMDIVAITPIVIEVEPAKLIKDVSHVVDSVQVLEEDLEMVTSEASTLETSTSTSDETASTSQEFTSDRPDETTLELDVAGSVNSEVEKDEKTDLTVKTNQRPLIANQDTAQLGVAVDNVQIVYAQNPNKSPPSTTPLIIDLKPNESNLAGVHLQNHNLNPSKFEPSLPDNHPLGYNKFPDYPFSLDEIHNRRPLGEDFHHRESFVRFPGDERVDHRVNVVKFPQDHGYPGEKFNNRDNFGWQGNTRYRPAPPPPPPPQVRFWGKIPYMRTSQVQQVPRRPLYDRRRPPPMF